MSKANSKQISENIKKYIIENYTCENYGYEETENFEEIAKIIYECFQAEKFHINGNEKDLFIEWCSGLPSILDTCYYYNRSAVEDLGKILEETQEERSKHSEHDAEYVLTKLIYLEIKKAL